MGDLLGKLPAETGTQSAPGVGEPGNKNGGRPKGVANKLTQKIKAAIESALDGAGDDLKANGHGGEGGADTYLRWLARCEPKAYATLLGKLLPTKIAGSDDPNDSPLLVERIERTIVKPKGKA